MFHKFDLTKKLNTRKIMHNMPVSIYKINNNNNNNNKRNISTDLRP